MAAFTLDAYAAGGCPVKTANRFDPRVSAPPVDESLQELFAGREQQEQEVCAALIASGEPDSVVDLRGAAGSTEARVAMTLRAAADGAPLIIGGWLPADPLGHRRGHPDLLARFGEGYLPVEIKRHRITENRRGGRTPRSIAASRLAAPGAPHREPVPDLAIAHRRRERDLLQLAHHWLLLHAAGLAASGPRLGGVIGTDKLFDGEPGVVWIDLDEPEIRTFSRSSETGWAMRSAMERYRHEHEFRVLVAERALQQGTPGAEPHLVAPIRIRECDRCPWWSTCQPLLDTDDLSLRIAKAPLDVREISVLRGLGVRTVSDLVAADLDALLPRYLPEVRHRDKAEERLRLTARKAGLMERGVRLERITQGPIDLPAADIEIDFDIETAADERVYLWGFLVDDGAGAPSFVEHSAWADLDDDAELALARAAATWLRGVVESPGRPMVRVYHYSEYELVRMRQIHQRSGDPLLAWMLDFAATNFVDLFETVRDNYFGVDGLGLKVVAREGAGFAWRDADAGGLASQQWFDEAVHADTAAARALARTRVLEYNEDDVLATHRLRSWMRQDPGRISPA